VLLQRHHLLWQLQQPHVLLLQVSNTMLQLHHLLPQLLVVLLVLLKALCCQHWALVKPVTQLLPHWPVTLQMHINNDSTAAVWHTHTLHQSLLAGGTGSYHILLRN
jgi:hypothetical protein